MMCFVMYKVPQKRDNPTFKAFDISSICYCVCQYLSYQFSSYIMTILEHADCLGIFCFNSCQIAD